MALLRWLPLVAASIVVGACSSGTANPPGLPACTDGSPCHSAGALNNGTSGGNGGAGGDASSGAGGGDTATVTGTIVAVNSFGFDASSAYSKPATVYGDGPGGKQIAQAYDGS